MFEKNELISYFKVNIWKKSSQNSNISCHFVHIALPTINITCNESGSSSVISIKVILILLQFKSTAIVKESVNYKRLSVTTI